MSNDQAINLSADSGSEANAPIAWIDIFLGMLISPIRTLKTIGNPEIYTPGMSAIFGSAGMVTLCGMARTPGDAYCSSLNEAWLSLIASVLVNVFFWLVIACFVRQIAALMKIPTSIRICLVVTGWAFFPLIFKAVATCFSHATLFGNLLSWCTSAWFLVLELFAFDSILKLGRFKTLGIVLIVPPFLYLTYFLSMVFAGLLITDGLF